MAGKAPITVVETPELLSATRKVMTETERSLLVDYLSYNPTAGDLISGADRQERSSGPQRRGPQRLQAADQPSGGRLQRKAS